MTTDPTPDDPRDLTLHRDVDAPRALVWTTLTQPTHLERWWGPTGFRTETQAYELRPGGSWRLTMHGPDGRPYVNHAVFDEVVAPERLVLRYVAEPGTEPARHITTITLAVLGPTRTRVTLSMRFPSAEERREVAEKYGAVEGGRQTLGRLAALLDALQASEAAPSGETLVLRRVLAAPPALVWAAWTDATHLTRWFHPTSWSIFHAELDLRVGGTFHYGFRGAEVPETWALWEFTEVVPTRRLAFLLAFADAERRVVPSPFGGPWPTRTRTVVTIERHAGIGGGTVLTVESTPFEAADAEVAAFREMFPSMEMGWGETFDSLVGFLVGAG